MSQQPNTNQALNNASVGGANVGASGSNNAIDASRHEIHYHGTAAAAATSEATPSAIVIAPEIQATRLSVSIQQQIARRCATVNQILLLQKRNMLEKLIPDEMDRILVEDFLESHQEEAEQKAKEEAEQQKAKEEAEQQKAKEEAEQQKAKEEAEQQKAKEEAEQQKAKEEAEQQKAKEEAEQQKAKEEAARKEKGETEQKAKEESEKKAKEEAARKAIITPPDSSSPGKLSGVDSFSFEVPFKIDETTPHDKLTVGPGNLLSKDITWFGSDEWVTVRTTRPLSSSCRRFAVRIVHVSRPSNSSYVGLHIGLLPSSSDTALFEKKSIEQLGGWCLNGYGGVDGNWKLENTNMSRFITGDVVKLEVDVISKTVRIECGGKSTVGHITGDFGDYGELFPAVSMLYAGNKVELIGRIS